MNQGVKVTDCQPPGLGMALDSEAKSEDPKSNVPMRFSLFFFASSEGRDSNMPLDEAPYHLEIEAAQWADRYDLEAIWTPERHFQAFGSNYPNPSVLSAALAMVTERIRIRAGSVVLPLHHPVRIAEEWALVDHLSKGRIGIAAASGWHKGDFVLAPHNFASRRDTLIDHLDKLTRLWRGEKVAFPNNNGTSHYVMTYPRPYQRELPIWITSAGNIETWLLAARLGANVLTGIDEIEAIDRNIRTYRNAREASGFDPRAGIVTLMIHTYLTDDKDEAQLKARDPLKQYLEMFVSQRYEHNKLKTGEHSFTAHDLDDLLEHAVDDYFKEKTLIGSTSSCIPLVTKLQSVGVNEIACLINFGISKKEIIGGLENIRRLKEHFG